VKVGDGGAVYRRLLEKGVIVRPVANYEMPQYLRVSIGLESENARFLQALRESCRYYRPGALRHPSSQEEGKDVVPTGCYSPPPRGGVVHRAGVVIQKPSSAFFRLPSTG